MSQTDAIARDLERQIAEIHERFSGAMAVRCPLMSLEQKERYFVVISTLVSKLEDRAKPLKQVLQEVIAEVLPQIMAELQS